MIKVSEMFKGMLWVTFCDQVCALLAARHRSKNGTCEDFKKMVRFALEDGCPDDVTLTDLWLRVGGRIS